MRKTVGIAEVKKIGSTGDARYILKVPTLRQASKLAPVLEREGLVEFSSHQRYPRRHAQVAFERTSPSIEGLWAGSKDFSAFSFKPQNLTLSTFLLFLLGL